METPLQRVQDHLERVGRGERNGEGFPPELIPDLKTVGARITILDELDAYAADARREFRRLGFDVQLSPYLQSMLRIEREKELFSNAS